MKCERQHRSLRSRLSKAVVILCAAAISSCGGWQSVVDPAGPQAARIDRLWWFLFGLLAAIYVAVLVALAIAAFLSRRTHTDPDAAPRFRRNVTAAVVATALILVALIVVSVSTGKAVSTSLVSKQALVIEVTGHQWWWEIRYPDYQEVSRYVTTANEIHVPVGRPVMFKLKADDVIHSLWIPNLSGKTDLIPSRVNVAWIQADRPGVYRGQCAEYCGLQHAHMALFVIAEPPEEFARWLDEQRKPAIEPQNATQARGRQVFLEGPCALCHTIRGTGAFGAVAPDLTHFGSRRAIGSGTLPNSRGNLGGWVTDSQTIKPGNRMPPINLPPPDLQALISYVESLE